MATHRDVLGHACKELVEARQRLEEAEDVLTTEVVRLWPNADFDTSDWDSSTLSPDTLAEFFNPDLDGQVS